MESSNGRLYFSAGIDNSQLQADAQTSKEILQSLSEAATQQGQAMDAAFQAASLALADMGKDFSTSTTEEKLDALNKVIETQEAVIGDCCEALQKYQEDANAAFLAGDMGTFQAINQDIQDQIQKIDELTAETNDYRNAVATIEQAAGMASSAEQQLSATEGQHSSTLVTLLGGQEKYNEIIKMMPAPVQNAASAITGMTGAAKAFIATPLGAALAAIILAIQTLTTWFKSSAEGQMAFAEISGYVSGVLGQLKEIVIAVGKAIYNAFKDPQAAVQSLWNSIKKNIVTRIQSVGDTFSALGKVIKSVFNLDFDGIKAGLNDMGKSIVDVMTGVEDTTDKMANYVNHVNEAAKATSQLAVREEKLHRQRSSWQIEEAKLNDEIEAARTTMYTSTSDSERLAAAQKAQELINKKYQQRIKFAQEEYNIVKERNALTTNAQEDYDKENAALAQLTQLQADMRREQSRFARTEGSLARSAENAAASGAGASASASAKAAETQRKEEEKSQELLKSIIRDNIQQEIDLMEEGAAQKLEKIKADYQARRQEIEEQAKEMAEANKAAGIADTNGNGLTTEQQEAVDKAQLLNEQNQQKKLQEVYDGMLADIMTYEQSRLRIIQDYAKKREELYTTDEEGNRVLRDGVTEGNVANLDENEQTALAAIDEQFAAREDDYQAWCDSIANLSLEKLQQVLDQAEQELAALEASGTGDSTQLATARAKVNTARTNLNKASAKNNNTSPDQRSVEQWNELREALDATAGTFKELGEEIGGTAGEMISTVGEISTAALSAINGIVTLVNNSGTAMQSTAVAASTAIQTVEKASVILAVISAALQVANAIASLFNDDDQKQEQIEHLQSRIDSLQWELDNQSTIILQDNTFDVLEKLETIVTNIRQELAATQVEQGQIFAAFQTLYGSITRNNEVLAQSVDAIADAYAQIAYSADKALGEDKYNTAREQLENIAEQQLLIRQQIEEEESKKDTDSDQIEEWEEELQELAQTAVDTINEIVEEIMGGTSSEIAEQLSDAFFEAFENGEDAAEAWAEEVNDLVKSIIQQMVVSKFLEEPVAEIFDKYKSLWYDDEGNFAGIDSVLESMSGLTDDLNAVGEEFSEIWQGISDSYSDYFEASREASESGIATASQESVDELNGRMTAVQSHTYSINENTKLLTTYTANILESVLNIEIYTEAMNKRLANVETDMATVRSDISDIATKGIKLK